MSSLFVIIIGEQKFLSTIDLLKHFINMFGKNVAMVTLDQVLSVGAFGVNVKVGTATHNILLREHGRAYHTPTCKSRNLIVGGGGGG